MSKFKSLTIRKKIVITALALILIIAALKIYEMNFINQMESSIVTDLEKGWNVQKYSEEVQSNFLLSSMAVNYYTVSKDKKWLDTIKSSKAKLYLALQNLKNDSKYDEINKIVASLEPESKKYYQSMDKALASKSGLNNFVRANKDNAYVIATQTNQLASTARRFSDNNKSVIQIIFHNTKEIAFLTSIMMVVLTLCLVYLQLRFLLSPIGELLHGIKLMWAGDTSHKIDITTNDEIGELAKVFNYMAGSIHREQKRLFEKATTDEMTGLHNFRYFQEVIAKEFEKAKRFNRNLSFVIMDVDFFKFYNDNNGHPAGDQVLKSVASVVKNSCRGKDVPARYGGEEFVVVLPDTPIDAAAKVADRIREAIALTQMPHQEKQPNGNLTVSVGVANYPLNARNAKDLVEFADGALYDAKSSGKNKVCISKEKAEQKVTAPDAPATQPIESKEKEAAPEKDKAPKKAKAPEKE